MVNRFRLFHTFVHLLIFHYQYLFKHSSRDLYQLFFKPRQPGKDVKKDTCPDKILLARSKLGIKIIKIQINVKKILTVINATYAVVKRKPEKIRLAGIRTLTSAIPVQRSNQLSYQANWELVIKLVCNIPGKDEDEIMNI